LEFAVGHGIRFAVGHENLQSLKVILVEYWSNNGFFEKPVYDFL